MQKNTNDKNIQSTGKGMIYIAWILGLFLMYLIFDGALKKQYNPNSQPRSLTVNNKTQVVLQRNSMGHYVTSGSINHVDTTFMIDTGATDIAVPEKLAQKMQLKKLYPMTMSTANGTVKAWGTKIRILKIGELTLYNLNASINPGMNHVNEVLLGMSALKNLDFQQQGNTLTLKQSTRNE